MWFMLSFSLSVFLAILFFFFITPTAPDGAGLAYSVLKN